MNDELTIEQKIAIARAPITVGILATSFSLHKQPSMAYAGCGERPGSPTYGADGRAVGSRALKLTDGEGF